MASNLVFHIPLSLTASDFIRTQLFFISANVLCCLTLSSQPFKWLNNIVLCDLTGISQWPLKWSSFMKYLPFFFFLSSTLVWAYCVFGKEFFVGYSTNTSRQWRAKSYGVKVVQVLSLFLFYIFIYEGKKYNKFLKGKPNLDRKPLKIL